jgi:hypothetical protein
MAQERFRAGLKLFDKGDYEAARLEFMQAQAIFPRPSLLRNLAMTELRTHRPLEALQHLQALLADGTTSGETRVLGERDLGEAYAQTGHLSISAPVGARVKVDGTEVGVAPLKGAIDLAVGPHGVDADAGGVAMHESVNATAGKLTEVAFVKATVAQTQVVQMPGGGGAGGAGMGKPAPIDAVIGVPPATATPYWNGRRTVGIVIAGVGVVGMVVGGVFGAERGGATTDATNALASAKSAAGPSVPASAVCTNPSSSGTSSCVSLSNALSSNGSDAHVEEVMLVGGGVLVAVGLITAFWPEGKDAPTTGIVPSVGPHNAGLQWSGSF